MGLSTLSVLALVLTGTLVTAHETDLRRRLGLFYDPSIQERLEANAAKVSEYLDRTVKQNQLFDSFAEDKHFMTREEFNELGYATLYVFTQLRDSTLVTVANLKHFDPLLSRLFSTYRSADKQIIRRGDFKAFCKYLKKEYRKHLSRKVEIPGRPRE